MAYVYPAKYVFPPLTWNGRKYSVFMVDTGGVGLMIGVFEETGNGLIARYYSMPEPEDIVRAKIAQYGYEGYLDFFVPGINQFFASLADDTTPPNPNLTVDMVDYTLVNKYEFVQTIDGLRIRKKQAFHT